MKEQFVLVSRRYNRLFLLCFPDVFVDWKQNVNEVTVRLRCGDGVQRTEDISTTFTDTHCHVCFPGKSEETNPCSSAETDRYIWLNVI